MRKEVACRTIQKDLRTYLARKAYNRLCSSAISIQTGMRVMGACNELHFRKQTKATIIIQSPCRGYLAHLHYLRRQFPYNVPGEEKLPVENYGSLK